jgi:hypothetical protein
MATVVSTQNINTPSILTAAGTALSSNRARIGWSIQNLGTNPLFVLLGSGASTTVFHYVIKGGTASDDGLGGSLVFNDVTVYNGIVTVAGTTPRFVVTEIAP